MAVVQLNNFFTGVDVEKPFIEMAEVVRVVDDSQEGDERERSGKALTEGLIANAGISLPEDKDGLLCQYSSPAGHSSPAGFYIYAPFV